MLNIIQNKINIIIFSVFLLFFSFLLSDCDDSKTDANSPDISEIGGPLIKISDRKSGVEKFAKTLSVFLSNYESQKILEEKIRSSKYYEKIIEATEILNTDVNIHSQGKNKKGKLMKEIINLARPGEKDEIAGWLNGLKFGDIDIYFPVKEHREKWKAGDELLVVGFIPTEENKEEPVKAFSTLGGTVYLSQKEAPATPTLVIYPSEKEGNYIDKAGNSDNKIEYAPTLPEDPPPPSGDNWYNCRWTGILVAHDYEGWLMGAMEIYLKIKYKQVSGGSWSSWTNDYGTPKYISNIDAGHWKRGLNQELVRLPSNFDMVVEVWEHDEPPLNPDDFVADQYYNVIKECGETGSVYGSTSVIRCGFDPCVDFFLLDGSYPGSDYDMVELHFNRRYAE